MTEIKEQPSQESIWQNNHQVGLYGVNYLDDTLSGISRDDLVVIGARSGAGKSSIAEIIFNRNCDDTNCVLFSLENFSGDMISKSNHINYMKITGQKMTLREWDMNLFKVDWDALKQAEEKTRKFYAGKRIITRNDGMTISDICVEIERACKYDEAKLIILDHLDYIDKDNPNDTDVAHITELMRTIRNVQNVYKVGIVAVSHLKKPDAGLRSVIIPNENEFIGSGNKVKEATVVIMLAPDDDGNRQDVNDDLKRTWCCIRKNRKDGINNKVANIIYDKRTRNYKKNYDLYSVNYIGSEVEFIEKKGNSYE